MAIGTVACGSRDTPTTTNEEPSGSGAAGSATASSASAGSARVSVVAEDIRFPVHAFSATAGEIAISYRNDGAIGHTLVIDGVEGFKLSIPKHGAIDEGTVQLKPGTYTMYCDIPGHRQAGMEATLEVH